MLYIFNSIRKKDIFDTVITALYENKEDIRALAVSKLACFGIEEGLNGNLWQNYLLCMLIFNDNPYTRRIERNPQRYPDLRLAREDLFELYKLYIAKMPWMEPILSFEYPEKDTPLSQSIKKLISQIGDSYESFENAVLSFYRTTGLGDMALYKAFRVDKGILYPIYHVLNVSFDDLIGYDDQKELLKENTENFIRRRTCNNVLLYGDSGTGKSTSVKALLNAYFEQGLRIIEVYKHQMEEISKIIPMLKSRPYFYIIYMDDLSFEEDEVEYKYLKSIIEGGIEPKPDNVLIYATSNRRHLIRESFLDNQTDDLHRNETQAEKLSLAYRFGLQIFYSSLSNREFKSMVLELARRNHLRIAEDILLQEAARWELTYGTLSGRCAAQFVSYMSNKISEK